MPYILALSMGFILAAISPAVVVSGMFELESNGYGVQEGIPSLIIASASFDGVVAISGFSICIASAIPSNSDNNNIIDNLDGLFNFIGGIIIGYFAGYIISLTILWNSQIKRTVITLSVGLMCSFIGAWYGYGGGGALAALVMAVIGAKNWRIGYPLSLSEGPNLVANKEVGIELAKIWNILAQPLLFAIIGTSVDFRSIDMDIIPLALLTVFSGMILRVFMAFIATCGAGLTLKARFFIALSWIPKATVQAALGSVPLDLIVSKMSPNHPKYNNYVKWGNDIVVIAVLAILITAPIGLIVFNKLGPIWLDKKDENVIDIVINNINEIKMNNIDDLAQIKLEEGNQITTNKKNDNKNNKGFLNDYIHYSSKNNNPIVSEDIKKLISHKYTYMRSKQNNNERTPRTIETLLRLSCSNASSRLSLYVEEIDVNTAIELVNICLFNETNIENIEKSIETNIENIETNIEI